MSDVLITYSVLNELNGSLKQIIVELEEAENRSNELEGAVKTPFGKSELRDAVSEFESGWNDRRGRLKEDIQKVQKHVEEVGNGWENWDKEASQGLGVESNEAATLPRK